MSWTHFGDDRPVARKTHQCWLCERPIEVGTRHVRRRGTHGEGIVVMRMHEPCVAATGDWDQSDWECPDAVEFRACLDEGRYTQAEGAPPP